MPLVADLPSTFRKLNAQFDPGQGCVDNITMEQEIKKLAYKPGWEFSFQPDPDMLVTVMYVQDAWREGQWCNFTVKRLIPDYVDTPVMLVKWWKGVLADVEMHELREFARYDGELIDTPHDSQ